MGLEMRGRTEDYHRGSEHVVHGHVSGGSAVSKRLASATASLALMPREAASQVIRKSSKCEKEEGAGFDRVDRVSPSSINPWE